MMILVKVAMVFVRLTESHALNYSEYDVEMYLPEDVQ